MWDIKQKATSEQTAQTNLQTQTTVWRLPEWEGGRGTVKWAQGGQTYGVGRRLDVGCWACKSAQITNYNLVQLKFIYR